MGDLKLMAKSKKESVAEKYTTGKGELVGFISVNKPSTTYKDTGEYTCGILLSKEEGEKILKLATKIRDKQYEEYRKNTKVADITFIAPYVKVEKDAKGKIIKETPDSKGRYVLKTKEGAYMENGIPKNKIAIYDSKLNAISSVNIGEGTIAKLCVLFKGYSTNLGTGVSAKLKMVQIIDLKEFSSSNPEDFGLTEEDGFEISDDVIEESNIETADDEDDGEADF